MRISDIILVESDAEWKFMVSLSGTWISKIQQKVDTARKLYDDVGSPENHKILLDTIEDAKNTIIETVNSPVLADSNHKIAKRIVRQYNEYFYRLISKRY